MNTILEGIIVVNSPLPFAVMGVYVDKTYLAEEIALAWTGRQMHNNGMPSEQPRLRSLERILGELLFTMKAALSSAGRVHEWQEILDACGVPIDLAEQLVTRCQRRFRRRCPTS
jgi:hypothetical protein